MSLEQLFEDILFECNLKPLFEQILKEMAVARMFDFSDWLEDRVKKALNNMNLDETIIHQAIKEIIHQNNRTTEPPAPFVVLDSGNQALVCENANETYIIDLTDYKRRSGKDFIISINTKEDIIRQWITASTNDVLENNI